MSIKEILEFRILELDNYSLTLINLLGAIVTIVITKLVILAIEKVLNKYSEAKKIDKGRQHSLFAIVKYFIWVIAITIGLEIVGVKITILVASSAALLVGLGLGLQQIFNDLVSGLFLLFEGTVKVGNVMEIDGIVGKVREINLRASKVITRDDIVMIVPNHKFISENVINWSHNQTSSRFHITVRIAYGSDTALVKSLLLGAANELLLISRQPAPFVRFDDFGDSGLIFSLYFWGEEVFRIENVKSDLRFLVDQKFRENNIIIPFPQRDLHIKSSNSPNNTPPDGELIARA